MSRRGAHYTDDGVTNDRARVRSITASEPRAPAASPPNHRRSVNLYLGFIYVELIFGRRV